MSTKLWIYVENNQSRTDAYASLSFKRLRELSARYTRKTGINWSRNKLATESMRLQMLTKHLSNQSLELLAAMCSDSELRPALEKRKLLPLLNDFISYRNSLAEQAAVVSDQIQKELEI